MILHITPDDKFVPFLQGLFDEALPSENMWRVHTDKKICSFALPNKNTEIVTTEYFQSSQFIDDLRVADCVIFHSLFLSARQKWEVLRRLPKQMPIVWRGWGYDYYPYLEANGLQVLLPVTKAHNEQACLNSPRVNLTLKKIFKKLLRLSVGKLIDLQFQSRVSYFSCCVPNDYVDLKRALPRLTARFLPLNYYSKEDVFLKGEDLQDLSGKDILLGNSASNTNNHIEALQMLSELGMKGRKVIVPLAYGDMKYQAEIISLGEELLGESFVPLTKYMSLSEYNQVISGCGNLMMNHVRQQAMGNISAALLRGGKVFLRPENPIYKYYSQNGVRLYLISNKMTIAELNEPISADDVFRNKEILTGMWARKVGVSQARAFARQLTVV